MTYLDMFTKLNSFVTELDCYLALAQTAVTAPAVYVKPQMLPMGSGEMQMMEARHPCLEQLQLVNGGSFIPNDISMERGKSNVQIITGVRHEALLK
jgi:DNA mismatch repair protein MSH2